MMTQQRSTVDSRRRLTNFKMLFSLETACLTTVKMLNEVLEVSSGTREQFVEDAVKVSNIFVFSTFIR